MLKDKLCHEPILKYPDMSKPYTLFTDASNYGWAGVLTQEYKSTDIKGNECTTLHPVACVSGLIRGSQLTWAALTKEAYTIYMCIRRLTFYISDMKVTLWSDHLPLKKFLLKNNLNDHDEFGQYCFEELPKVRTKVDQKIGNTSSEGNMVEISEIRVIYNEEIDHESDKIHVYLPLPNEKLISLQENDAQVSKI